MFEDAMMYFTILASFLIIVAFLRSTNMIVLTLLNGSLSLFVAIMYLVLDAPDVAMTEVSISVLVSVFAVYAIKKMYKGSYIIMESFNPWIFLFCTGIGCLLIYSSFDLVSFGQANFDSYYLENSKSDIGINSVVAAILAGYRGYDTFFETIVIVIAGLSVMLVSEQTSYSAHKRDQLISTISRFIFPVILLFALYIQMHGEVSPGGGFQAGAIIATVFMLYGLAFGEDQLLSFISLDRLKIIAVIGVWMYFSVGIMGLLGIKEFLNYSDLGAKNAIMIVELGVGVAVSATMILIYLSVANV
jgi:multicomponent Na+:H+ antiporter subunit B